jgi:virginiamycin A acetyltransferase
MLPMLRPPAPPDAQPLSAYDVPPYTVVGGVPARPLKARLQEDQVSALRRIQWWNWPEEKICQNLDLLYGEVASSIRVNDEPSAS